MKRRRGPVQRRRCRGDRGSSLAAALALLFAFTSVGVILLARDYDERIATRSVAQSIAFQAARAGAQQVAVGSLRGGELVLDVDAAEEQAVSTARSLLASHGERGDVEVYVVGDRVTVVVEIVDVVDGGFAELREATITAEGSAQAVSG